MDAATATGLDGNPTTLTVEAIRGLADRLHGPLLTAEDDGYEEARRIWNAMIDRRPAVIARCTGAADVMRAVRFGREHELLVSIHGGGHNVAGNAVCDGGLMIDLSPMNQVRVDPAARTARVGAGSTVADLDHETQAFGLATTGGIVSTTGVAGITLGGGLGFLARTFGLVHDNLRSVDVVTAEGELVHASPEEHPGLFWGMRGGGGNFGIATSFQFDLHELGPEILSVRAIWPYEAAPDVLRFYREFMADAPNEVQLYAAFLMGSPEYGLPEPLHGKTLLAVRGLYAGDLSDGREVFRPLREFGNPIAAMAQPLPYTTHQRQLDELYRSGHRNYWKSDCYEALSDGLIEAVMEHVDPLPTEYSMAFFEWMGGRIAEAPPDATAFPHRDAAFALTVAPKWEAPARDEKMIAWARTFHQAVEPFAAEGVYVNYLDRDDLERMPDAYGDRLQRLVVLKSEWDPGNLFRMNQNIPPAR